MCDQKEISQKMREILGVYQKKHLTIKAACEDVSETLAKIAGREKPWTYEHIHQIASGCNKPGKVLAKAIKTHHQELFG